MRVKSASCAPATADRAHEYPHQILSMRSPAAPDKAIEKDFFLFFFSIVAICIILFIVSSKHTIDIHTTETKRREVMEAEDSTAAAGRTATRRRPGGWLYGRHIMEQQK